MRKLKKYKLTRFMDKGCYYDKASADYAVAFIESLCHTKGTWARKPCGHPVLRWMMDNIFIRTDPAGNIKPDKEKSTEKIDGAVASIMALDRAIRRGNDTTASVYDDRGILFI